LCFYPKLSRITLHFSCQLQCYLMTGSNLIYKGQSEMNLHGLMGQTSHDILSRSTSSRLSHIMEDTEPIRSTSLNHNASASSTSDETLLQRPANNALAAVGSTLYDSLKGIIPIIVVVPHSIVSRMDLGKIWFCSFLGMRP
jgi:hypothetical protein